MAADGRVHVITRDEVRSLIEDRPGPVVSLYQPTSRTDLEQNVLRLKNLVGAAEERLEEHGLRKAEVTEVLRPVSDMVSDRDFWRRRLDGLVIFAAPGFVQHLHLPFRVEEKAVAARTAYVKPLLPALSLDGHFFVLAISQKAIRLLRATRFGIDEVDLSDVDIPRSLDEELQFDQFEAQLQGHAPSAGRAPGGRNPFHGHGADTDDHKEQIQRFFRRVDNGIVKLLGNDNAPLVIAAADYLHPLYRRASDYRNILDRGVEGNPDQLSPQELHERAWPVVEPHFKTKIDETCDRFNSYGNEGRASADLADVLAAAHAGRIECLMVRDDAERWGLFDAIGNTIEDHDEPRAGNVDLVDLAARQTIAHGGDVFVLSPGDMCGDGAEVAAVYRF